MRGVTLSLAVLFLPLTLTASHPLNTAVPAGVQGERNRAREAEILFHDDMESGVNGWTHVDETAATPLQFHVDTYYACDLSGHVGPECYWCGEVNGGWAGGDGYGNSWDQRLELPPVDVSAATYPVLTFKGRYDSEVLYDYTYVQAKQGGVYVNLNNGYNGSSGGWFDIGLYGFPIAAFDNPAECRFRFVSDGSWSDEDGLYDSDAGAFHCDDVKIYDFYGGGVYFFDDVDSGPLCTPSIPEQSGDYWHLVDRPCPAWSDPHVWWCGDDADTSLIPPNLRNSLISPSVDITGVAVCTLRYYLHAEVPTVDEDFWTESVSVDGGATWHQTDARWGDMGACDGWVLRGIEGVDVTPFLPGTGFRLKVTFHTTDDGSGPGTAGGAGIMLDDVWLEDWAGGIVKRACCVGDTCRWFTEQECTDAGGEWQEEVLSCEPDPCRECACCEGSTCQLQTELECVTAGGEWLDGIVSCDPNPCIPQEYVCCIDTTCQLLYEQECSDAGGVWHEYVSTCSPNPCLPAIWVVQADGTGDFATIEEAVLGAGDGDIILLADGIFIGPGNRDIDPMGKDLRIRSQSDDPTACVIDCQGQGRGFLYRSGEGPISQLRGVTITNAYVSGLTGIWRNGAAIHCQAGASPTVEHCVFTGNHGDWGGGLFCGSGASPSISDCVFTGNEAGNGGGVGVEDASPEFMGCVFTENSAAIGGGVAVDGSSPRFTNCAFIDNWGMGFGGGVAATGSTSAFIGCVFIENSAQIGGGAAIYFGDPGEPTFANCTFVLNAGTDEDGGGGLFNFSSGPVILSNTIIAYSTEGGAVGCNGGSITLQCCDVYGNVGGDWVECVASQYGVDGNVSADPAFCALDDHVLTLSTESPCAPENSGGCGLIGALPVDCQQAAFAAEPTFGPAPLSVQFTDLTPGDPTAWEWDFDNDGAVDDTLQHPLHVYDEPGRFSVRLAAYSEGQLYAPVVQSDLVHVLAQTNMVIQPTLIVSPDPTPVPIEYAGGDSLGAVSLYFEYDDEKLVFGGVETYVPGETFSAGIVGGQISVQWFDETGGMDPIVPGVDPDTLFALMFTNVLSRDTTRVTFNEPLCVLGDAGGDAIEDVLWVDESPYGDVYIDVGALVWGRVGYYWLDPPLPGALLSMGAPNPDVLTDAQGQYAFARYPFGNYVLRISKTTDLGGINSLDAIKVVRHSTGVEPLDNEYKETAANVNGDALINALDAIKIVRAAVGLENLPAGDWRFVPDSLAFEPLNQDTEVDVIAIRMGDVNGSWVPDEAPPTPPTRGRPERDPVVLSLPDTTLVIGDGHAEIPLEVAAFDSIGAISLRIAFSDTVLGYTGVASQVPGVTFLANLVGGEIRIEWYDPTGGASPMTVGADTLLTIGFNPIGDDGDSSPLDFTGACMIGDAEGDPIPGVLYGDGSCTLVTGTGVDPAIVDGLDAMQNYPNPFNPTTNIRFTLSKAAVVSVDIYSISGQHVRNMVDAQPFDAGVHFTSWDGTDDERRVVGSGVYFCRLKAGELMRNRKMILMK